MLVVCPISQTNMIRTCMIVILNVALISRYLCSQNNTVVKQAPILLLIYDSYTTISSGFLDSNQYRMHCNV